MYKNVLLLLIPVITLKTTAAQERILQLILKQNKVYSLQIG